MLALTRKVDQRIQIGRDIFITILQIRGKQVRIGIEAPQQVRVKRGELPDDGIDGQTLSVADLLAPAGASFGRAKSATAKRRPIRRRPGSVNPGERAFSAGCRPLAEKLYARRALHAAPVAVA